MNSLRDPLPNKKKGFKERRCSPLKEAFIPHDKRELKSVSKKWIGEDES